MSNGGYSRGSERPATEQWSAAPESEWDYGWANQPDPEPEPEQDSWSVRQVERRSAGGWSEAPPAQRLPRDDGWPARSGTEGAPAQPAGGRPASPPAQRLPDTDEWAARSRAGEAPARAADVWSPRSADTRSSGSAGDRPQAADGWSTQPAGSGGAPAGRRSAEAKAAGVRDAQDAGSPWEKTQPAWGEPAPPRNGTRALRGGGAFPRSEPSGQNGTASREGAPRSGAAPQGSAATVHGSATVHGAPTVHGSASRGGTAPGGTAPGGMAPGGAGPRGALPWEPGAAAGAAALDNTATTGKAATRSDAAPPSAAVTEVLPVTKAPIPTGARPPQAARPHANASAPQVPGAEDAPTQLLPAQAPAPPRQQGPGRGPVEVPEAVPGIEPDPGTEPMSRSRQRALERAKDRQRRRRVLVFGILLVAVALIGVDLMEGPHIIGGPARHPAKHAVTAKPTAPAPTVPVPSSGRGTFAYATGTGPLVGTAGTVRKYRVAVENGTGQDATAFATLAQQTLADPRGWIKGGDVRFQRVGEKDSAQFTVYLATPATSEKMCAQGGVHTQRLISCRLPGQVIINLAPWLNAIPGYGAPVATYQQFTLNHEIGRELGHGNEACPGPGALAPVMLEQTLGLDGCVANAWPYVNGARYSGPVMP